ncbi:MAG: hypothetical protein KAG66_15635 [Methylococcales bacterium]|nr:hypothetical protein [Methylococcales bacterium]
MSIYDYGVIAFYLLFMLLLGPVYKSFSKTASDYFRGGGGMLWWVVGSSTFMTTFSAWSFTGGAAKAYETGTFFLLLFLCNFIGLFFTYFFAAPRFRQMRVVTAIEAVRKRYGNANEQVFTWLPLAFRVLAGGIALYAIAVFMHGVFHIDMAWMIIILGVTATGMTLLGGSWAATAGDFVQMLILLSITLLMAGLTLSHSSVGGVSGLIEKLPEQHFDWTMFDRPWVIVFFALTLLVNQVMQNNSMLDGAAKYVFVKDGRDAKRSVLISIVGFLLMAPVWLIPAMAAAVLHPNLAAEFPELNNPNEAAYVAMAIELLPKGLLGLMICAIFAASMTSLNSMLNVVAGTFVRNFYIRVVDQQASETRQILVGRICTLVFGILWIMVGLLLKDFKELKLFDLVMIAGASIGIPSAVPLFFGMFVKRTPSWSGWSTVVIGSATAVLLRVVLNKPFINRLFSPESSFGEQEFADLNIALTTGVLAGICISWYFLTMLFYRSGKNESYARQVDEFFVEMNTPVDTAVEHGPSYDNDSRQYLVLGNLCLIYGSFILLLLGIPNSMTARLAIFACGVFIAGTGWFLRRIANGLKKKMPCG